MELAGRCGIQETEFWAMTPRFFYRYTKGWETNRREGLETARNVAYFSLIAPHVDLKKKMPKMADLWPFSWEAEEKAETTQAAVADQKAAMLAKLAEWQEDAKKKNEAKT